MGVTHLQTDFLTILIATESLSTGYHTRILGSPTAWFKDSTSKSWQGYNCRHTLPDCQIKVMSALCLVCTGCALVKSPYSTAPQTQRYLKQSWWCYFSRAATQHLSTRVQCNGKWVPTQKYCAVCVGTHTVWRQSYPPLNSQYNIVCQKMANQSCYQVRNDGMVSSPHSLSWCCWHCLVKVTQRIFY